MIAYRPYKLYGFPFKPMGLSFKTIDAMLAELATARVLGPGSGRSGSVYIYFADASGDDIEMAKVPRQDEAVARHWVHEFNREVTQRTLSLAA